MSEAFGLRSPLISTLLDFVGVAGKQTDLQLGHVFALSTASLPNQAVRHSRWKTWPQCVRMMASLPAFQSS